MLFAVEIRFILRELSRREKDTHTISLTCGILKKKRIQMNFFTKQKQTHRHKKQTYGYQRGRGEEERHKLGVWD